MSTEFYVSDNHGDVDEKNRKWNNISGRATAIGLKIAGVKVPGAEIPIPPTAKGMAQCRYATVRDGIATTEMQIIGFIDAAGKYHMFAYDSETGKPKPLPASNMDFKAHAIMF